MGHEPVSRCLQRKILIGTKTLFTISHVSKACSFLSYTDFIWAHFEFNIWINLRNRSFSRLQLIFLTVDAFKFKLTVLLIFAKKSIQAEKECQIHTTSHTIAHLIVSNSRGHTVCASLLRPWSHNYTSTAFPNFREVFKSCVLV